MVFTCGKKYISNNSGGEVVIKTRYFAAMSLYLASINSGSNGNCYYVGTETDAVLIDAGLSCRETEKRMARIGLKMSAVRAVFISHEHGDHIKGLESIATKYPIPIYITPPTLSKGKLRLPLEALRTFAANDAIAIAGMTITPFAKMHDAIDPHSFVIERNGVRVGVITDIGVACAEVAVHFAQCHAAVLEANYDEQMLENGRYPHHLKNRIRGGHGHVSNTQALELFVRRRHPHLSHLLLAHLSADNNNPELALNMFTAVAGKTKVVVASRYEESAVYHITGPAVAAPPKIKPAKPRVVQATLF